MAIETFKRIEIKYIINESQKAELIKNLLNYMDFDKYCIGGKPYHIQNIYYDTFFDSLISKSVLKPNYKAKVRVRHYDNDDTFYLEWKQKTNKIVSKRRVGLTEMEFEDFILKRIKPKREKYLEKQILDEFEYFIKHSDTILPALYLTYDRIALFSKDDKDLRITFDFNIKGSRKCFRWDQKNPEINIFDKGYILEIKASKNYPFWLSSLLSKLKIYHHSFSKYGNEYKIYLKGDRNL